MDDIVVREWQRAFGSEPTVTGFALVAVGGYGRRELFPYSDVDLLVLSENEAEIPSAKQPLSGALSALWDRGLRISHATRSVGECCRLHPGNTELHISLLDVRYLAGNPIVFESLQRRLAGFYRRHSQEIAKKLVGMTEQRHAKFNRTPYHLEPNIKECPGGLRDLHVVRWLAQLQPEQSAPAEFRGGLEHGGDEADSPKQFLFRLRWFLHERAGRDSNLLTYELQDEAARMLPSQAVPPEEWMRGYFRVARAIQQRCLRALDFVGDEPGSLLTQLRGWKQKRTSSHFYLLRDRVVLADDTDLFRSAQTILQLFSFVGEQGVPLSWDVHWSLEQNQSQLENLFRDSPPPWPEWEQLLTRPHTALALAEMHSTGALRAAIPPWKFIDSLVVRDFYHRYTVDEHTLVAVGEIDRLALREDKEHERFRVIAREDGPSAELRLALLLHDIGKGTTPGHHLKGSRVAAREVMAQMNVPEKQQNAVQFLIRHHLDLSFLMNGRDLEDPATARLLTSEVDTVEDLRRLTLLTFADISAVNPTAMNPWRAEQLWRVYSLGVQQLTWELASDRIHEGPAGFQEGRSPKLLEFLEGFPKRYIRTHSREEIEHHLQMANEARREGVAAEITTGAGAYLLTVLTYDKSGLFACLCGALASFGMSIVKGEASSNASKVVLDLIRFTDPNQTLALNPGEVNRLEAIIRDVVAGSLDVAQLLKKRRPLRKVTGESTIVPSVRFNQSASDESTLIDFVGEDRPGLLYDLATAISSSGCNIEVVMIDTEAHKALDVFYVTYQGQKLEEPLQEVLRERLVRAAWSEAAPDFS